MCWLKRVREPDATRPCTRREHVHPVEAFLPSLEERIRARAELLALPGADELSEWEVGGRHAVPQEPPVFKLLYVCVAPTKKDCTQRARADRGIDKAANPVDQPLARHPLA